jgi:hypothetical protein
VSTHDEWGPARTGLYQLVTRKTAPAEWDLPEADPGDVCAVGVTASHALGR